MRIKKRPTPRRPRVYTFDTRAQFLLARDARDLARLMVPVVRDIVDNVALYGIHNRPVEHKGLGKFCSRPIAHVGVSVAVYMGHITTDAVENGRVLRLKAVQSRQFVLVGAGPHDDERRLNAVVVVTTRPIREWEELLLDYGEAYFPDGQGSVPCRCRPICPKNRMF